MPIRDFKSRLLDRQMIGRWLVIAIPVVVLIGSQWRVYQTEAQSRQASRWVNHTYDVIHELERIDSGLSRAEAALRGYALTKYADVQPAFREGLASLELGFAKAVRLTGDSNLQRRRLRALEPRLVARMAQMREAMDAAQADLPVEQAATSDRLRLTREIHDAVEVLIRHERARLSERIAHADSETRAVRFQALSGAALALLLAALLFWDMKRQSSKLRQAEEVLRLTVDNAPIGMGLLTPEGRWMRINDALCQILGYARDELFSKDAQQLLYPDDRANFNSHMGKLLSGEVASFQIELRLQHREGRVVWADAAVSLVRSAQGHPKFIIAEIQDFTARRSAEAAAHTFFELATDMLAIRDPSGTFQKVNEAWERVLGWPRDVLTKTPYVQLVHPDDRARTAELEEKTHGPDGYALRNRFRAKDGRYRWLDWRGNPAPDGTVFCTARDVTEEVEREQDLRLYQRALLAASDGVLMTDPMQPDNPMVYVNPAFERMTGYAAQELLGRSCRILQRDDRSQPGIDVVRRAIAEQRGCTVLLRNYRKSGEMFLNALTVSPVFDATGRLIRYIGISEDVTDKKRQEEQVRLVERVVRLVVETKDVDTALQMTLSELCEALDWDYGELWFPKKGEAVLSSHKAWYAKDPRRIRSFRTQTSRMDCAPLVTLPGRVWESAKPEWHRDLAATGDDEFCRAEAARAAGFRACVGVPLSGEGAVEGVLVLLRNAPLAEDERQLSVLSAVAAQVGTVIQRKRAEHALAISEERMQLASKATSDVIYDWDVSTEALWLGEAITRNFGYEPRAAVRAWWKSLVHVDDADGLDAALRGAFLSDARHFSAEYRLRREDGSYAHVFDRGFIVRNAAGHALRLIGSIMDITPRVRSEEALRDAKEAAEAAAHAKTHFLANMSHEIRTPLTALLGFADLMLEPNLTEGDRLNYALTIRRNGEHLLSLLNDILDVAKLEAGKVLIEQIECSPTRILAEVTSLMRMRASDKGLSLELELQTEMPAVVRSDPTRLRQIVLNLVSNAVKFTDRGSVRVLARCEPRPSERPLLEIRVVDTGIGMDSEQVSRVFQPFSQADASMTRRFGGTGLGLAICAPIAAALGGELTVDTELGKGSTFTLRLPVEVIEAAAASVRPTAASGEIRLHEPAPEPRGRGSILLAEDGPDNQVLISTLLRRNGFEVSVAINGKVAVEKALSAELAQQPYDLVLMDMQMPELDGYNATALLLSRGFIRPIIALTAHAMSGERERCLRMGCNEYLSKPIDRGVLLRAVTAWIAKAADNDPGASVMQTSAPLPSVSAPRHASAPPLISDYAAEPEMHELIITFVDGLAAQLSTLDEALQRSDRATLIRVAHQLKGAAGGYGFPTITHAAADLERAAHDAAGSLTAPLANLRALCERARSGLSLAAAATSQPA